MFHIYGLTVKSHCVSGKTVKCRYGRGNVSGYLARENVMVGGIIFKGQDFVEGTQPTD